MPNSITARESVQKAPAMGRTEAKPLIRRRSSSSPGYAAEFSAGKWVSYRDAFLASSVGAQIREIRKGVRARHLLGFAKAAQVPMEYAYRLVGISASTAKRKLAGDEKLDPPAAERLTRIGAVEKLAEETFGRSELAREWLQTPHIELGNATPLSLLDTDIGTREVSRILNAIAYGGAA